MITIEIKKIKLSQVKLNPDNPRRIGSKEMDRLVKSLQEFPEMMRMREIVVDEKMIILGGNMRVLALRKAGEKEVTAKICRGLTEDQKREFVIKDNGFMGEWDFDALANSWSDLPLVEWGIDLPDFWNAQGDPEAHEDDFDADAAAEAIKEPITKTGDVWLLGKHRIMCGDSTRKEDTAQLMGEKKADMAFTDPPYGVSYADKNAMLNAFAPGNRIQTEITNDHKVPEEMHMLWNAIFASLHHATSDRASYYITGPQGGELMMRMMMSIIHAGWQLKHMIIWVKNNHVLGRCDYHYKHEPIFYGWKNGESHNFYGGTSEFSVWEIDKPLKSDLHPTMKPVELITRAITNSTKKGESVVDLCLGSGSTLIACEQLGRICYGMEIDPVYCDVIVKRWEQFTGKKAVLEK
jgi:DNA modification methylase